MSAVVDLLQELVRIPSVNPEGDPGTELTGEAACAEFLAQYLRAQGAKTEVKEILPGRPNIVGCFPSDQQGKPRLLFAPHTDTVSVLGMTIPPFGGELRDGKVWGRGSSDTKGPMAAMLIALANSRDIIPLLTHEIWFAGLMGEEAGQHGSHALAQTGKFDFVIAGEPTSLQTVFTHKGSLWLTVKATGVAVHGSTPERGKNAIVPVMEALLSIAEDFRETFSTESHPALGPATMNIGTIRGGSKVNIVPEECEAWVDIRFLPGQDMGLWVKKIQDSHPEVTITSRGSKPLYTSPDHPLIQKLQQCGGTPIGAPWFCDAAVFSQQGIAAVALGPGSIAQAHTADEWISVADLEAGVEFFTKFLKSLLPA